MTLENPAWCEVLHMRTVADIRSSAAENHFWATSLAAFALAARPDIVAALGGDLPYRRIGTHLVEIPSVARLWRQAMPLNLIDAHQTDLKQSDGIAIDYGYEDEFSHIPITARKFGNKLLELHIPVTLEGYHGDHNNGVPARVGSRLIPFLADHLHFSAK